MWQKQLLYYCLTIFCWSGLSSCALGDTLPIGQSSPCLNTIEFDSQVQNQTKGSPDSRLLIVEITEADIRELGLWPLNDRVVAQSLAALQQHHPVAIGWTLIRDSSIPPGAAQLQRQLHQPNIVMAQLIHLGMPNSPALASTGVPKNQLGFTDLRVDGDGVVRRNLLFTRDAEGEPVSSFAWQLALLYLKKQQIFPQVNPENENELKLGQTVLKPLPSTCNLKGTVAGDYQVPLQYRNGREIARSVTLTQVLKQQVKREWIRDKVVLVGVTATVFQDWVYTPYPGKNESRLRISSVILQAHMVSQLLTAALRE